MADTATPTHRRTALTWGDGCTALTAVIVGVFGAFSYYGDTVLRPFAHTFGIWILLVSVVSARQSVLCGAIRGGLALLTSVVSFFYGKQIYYDILYPGPGFPYRVQAVELLFWGGLGLVGGAVLGIVASRIGAASSVIGINPPASRRNPPRAVARRARAPKE